MVDRYEKLASEPLARKEFRPLARSSAELVHSTSRTICFGLLKLETFELDRVFNRDQIARLKEKD